jgi:hypothetical protein
MDLEEYISLRRVYNVWVTPPPLCRDQYMYLFSIPSYTTLYAYKVTSSGLFTGYHQTCTYNNTWKKLYSHPHNLEKEISSFAQVHKTGKTASDW